MKKSTKYAALFPAALLLSTLLTGCSGGGANAGVWIAVIVMVFIAVFSATSGIVYLVLQKVLPPEKPAARTRRPREYDYDDQEAGQYRPARPASAARPGNQAAASGVWVCPRDKSRNTGPYCSVCGGSRPAAPRPAPRPVAEAPAAQRPARPQSTPDAGQQAPSPRPNPYETEAAYQQPKPQQPAYRSPAPAQQPAEKPEYRGAFVRQPQSEPSALDTDFDSDIDSELLEAIFREAAQDDGEQ